MKNRLIRARNAERIKLSMYSLLFCISCISIRTFETLLSLSYKSRYEDYELEGDQQWFADSNENTTDKYGDEIGFYWDFDPYDFSEYGFEVQEKEYGFLITFNRFGYSTDEMPEEIFSSDAIKYYLDSLLKKYPDVAYYRYEGCVVIFHNTNETINEEYYSSENEIPETDDYIGERMSSLDWDEVINSFSEYDEDMMLYNKT